MMMTSSMSGRRLLASFFTSTSANSLKCVQSCLKTVDGRSQPSSCQLFCTSSSGDAKRGKEEGRTRELPSAAPTNPLIRADRFPECQNNLKIRMKKQFANINVNLPLEERGFYLRAEQDLFPMTRCRRFGDRVFQWVLERRASGSNVIEFDKDMQKASNAAYRRIQGLTLKHKLLNSGALSTNDVLLCLPSAAVQLCQGLRTNTIDRLVAQGKLTKEAVVAVQSRLGRLSQKQRNLFNLKKEDVCLSDSADIEDSTRVYKMEERRAGECLYLDFYAQCLMQYKKAQSCTVHYQSRPGKGLDILLPKDYGYSMPRPVYVMLRLTQQLKPQKTSDLIITAFNVVVCP